MTIQVTLFHTNDTPLVAGAEIELLGDGRVIATGIVGDHGAAFFEAQPEAVGRLAVRLSKLPAKKPQ